MQEVDDYQLFRTDELKAKADLLDPTYVNSLPEATANDILEAEMTRSIDTWCINQCHCRGGDMRECRNPLVEEVRGVCEVALIAG